LPWFRFLPTRSLAFYNSHMVSVGLSDPEDSIYIYELRNRLLAINSMDKSSLTLKEKKALRKEVKDINNKLSAKGFFLTVALLGVIGILVLILIKPF